MAAKVEANHAWLENVVYQANKMNEVEFMLGLGGPIAGLKGTSKVRYLTDISHHNKDL
jgi:hypothetical protein